jgi:hypothetical protein
MQREVGYFTLMKALETFADAAFKSHAPKAHAVILKEI